MRKEKIFLSFIAALIGILAAIVGFFLYQETRKIEPSKIKKITINPSPTPKSSIFLTVDRPKDEEVLDKRILTITGKTVPDAKIVIVTQTNEEGALASKNGNFSTEITLDEGENIIEISAVFPNGQVAKVRRVVTYTTESF